MRTNFLFLSVLLSLTILTVSCQTKNSRAQGTFGYNISEFQKVGEGEHTLLLIPCMSCRWNQWEAFMEQNKDLYTMYALTLPGNGGTRVPDLPVNIDGKTPWRDNALNALSNFIDEHDLKDITVMGHSWGTQIALQMAERRSDVISQLISVDGSIESKSWIPTEPKKIKRDLANVDSTNKALKNDAEEWRKFNSATYRYRPDSIATDDVDWALKLHGAFMATPKHVLHQYWRENLFINLTEVLHRVDNIPILDIQSFVSRNNDYEELKEGHLKLMEDAHAPDNIKYVFMYKTGHFIMQHRPEALNEIIYNYLTGQEVKEVYDF